MNDNEENKGYAINKIDYILQIRSEELKSEKETATSYSIRYREVINSFERKIFASAAAIVTFSTPVLALHVISQYIALSISLTALLIVIAAELLLSQHQKRTADLWFKLDGKYGSAISEVNEQRIHIASIRAPRIEKVELKQLIPYTTVREYRRAIMEAICEIFKNICLGYIERRLDHLWERQKNH